MNSFASLNMRATVIVNKMSKIVQNTHFSAKLVQRNGQMQKKKRKKKQRKRDELIERHYVQKFAHCTHKIQNKRIINQLNNTKVADWQWARAKKSHNDIFICNVRESMCPCACLYACMHADVQFYTLEIHSHKNVTAIHKQDALIIFIVNAFFAHKKETHIKREGIALGIASHGSAA